MVAVSVVMGTYNDADYLQETLDSVLLQDMDDLELIVVNDGSTDRRVDEVLSDYQHKDNRVQVISKDNEGLTRALIDGCNLAKGRYIARIDAGDAMLPNRLGKQIAVMEQYPECVFVSCWTEFCGPKWENLWVSKHKSEKNDPHSILPEGVAAELSDSIPHHGAVMFRQDAYAAAGGYRAEFAYAQDWDLWFRLVELGGHTPIQEFLYKARIFPGSISMSQQSHQVALERLGKEAYTQRLKQGSDKKALRAASEISRKALDQTKIRNQSEIKKKDRGYYFIAEALRRNGDARCRGYFLQAIARNPTKIEAYFRLAQSFVPVTRQVYSIKL